VGKDATTLAVFQSAVASAVRRLLLHDPVVRLDAGDEGVHQARVATRRLRSDLRTFRPLLDEPDEPPTLAPLLEELRWLGGLLGDVRDADVLGQRLREVVRDLDDPDEEAAQGLLDRLAAERAPMLDELHAAFDSDRYVRLVQALVELALDPPPFKRADTPARTTMPELAEIPWEHLVRRVGRLGHDPADEELHRVRILAKRARYAAEAAAVVVPAIADLQSVLGDHQDAVVAEAWLRRAVAEGAGGPESFAAGLLVTIERDKAAEHRRRWRSVWKDASRKKLTSWLPG
jgi:CHAD domain-containing protein